MNNNENIGRNGNKSITESQEHLDMVLSEIRKSIYEIDNSLLEGEKEIDKMHQYYWDNYTEMDEYGYENYDNRQALLNQVNENDRQLLLKLRYKKMLDSPYFGRVDFTYQGEDSVETYYIGIGNFTKKAGMEPLIFDWRAPVSALFYDFDKGAAQFSAPGGIMKGEIKSKWQYGIKNGKLKYAFESDVKIDDEILKQELSKSGDNKLKNIVSTIQKEQNEIIRNTKDKIMIVQGVAGSGKTSIALHRIAYLLYHDRKNLKASNILILSPNSVFADYISHILPELGEENIKEMSFDIFAYRQLKEYANDTEDRYDYIERKIESRRKGKDISENLIYKGSKEFAGEINGFILELEDEIVNIRDFSFKKIYKTADEIRKLFYEKFSDIPLLSRMDYVMEYVKDESETLLNRSYDEFECSIIKDKFEKMYATRDIYTIYNMFLKKMRMRTLEDQPVSQRKIPYEDVHPILYLKFLLSRSYGFTEIKHLVVDEMQDYSYIQYLIIEKMLKPGCRMTIVGDKFQTIDIAGRDVTGFLPDIFGKEIRTIVMNKSYRSTVEIVSYACKITGDRDMEVFERHGKQPVIYKGKSHEQICEYIADKLLNSGDSYDTTAIIYVSEKDAKEGYMYIKDILLNNNADPKKYAYLDKNSRQFIKGTVVTTFYLAKGLEFDRVFYVYDEDEAAEMESQARYISATRAMHMFYECRITKKE